MNDEFLGLIDQMTKEFETYEEVVKYAVENTHGAESAVVMCADSCSFRVSIKLKSGRTIPAIVFNPVKGCGISFRDIEHGIDAEDFEAEIFGFLEKLRESGTVNMWNVTRNIVEEFGITPQRANDLLMDWKASSGKNYFS